MTNKIFIKSISGAGRIFCLLTLICASSIAYAQDQRPAVSNIELRAGPRGMILVISGDGPIRVDIPGNQAARYPELLIRINNARSGLGSNQMFAPPQELPVEHVTITETPQGVTVLVKARDLINGPVDTRASENQARILMTKDALPVINWSAGGGRPAAPVQTPDTGGEITPEPVDMKKMEERAVRDLQAQSGQTFAVNEAPPPQQQQRQSAPPPPAAPVITPPRGDTPRPRSTPATPAASEVTRVSPEGQLVRYRVYGRDPFVPLVRDTTDSELPRVENLRLVGILEDSRERIALVEDFRDNNKAFALRTNDPVEFGRVLRIDRNRVVFIIRDFDVSRSYTLSLSQ
ncbi:MAG: hypothetical protein LBC70_06855 [Chitinispirillales bacterium]|jgi:hypothetical protein|nr:hypothetical protein [Chitinispirillales bacterium]